MVGMVRGEKALEDRRNSVQKDCSRLWCLPDDAPKKGEITNKTASTDSGSSLALKT